MAALQFPGRMNNPHSLALAKRNGCQMAKARMKAKRTRYDIYAEIVRVIYIYGHCPLTRAARSTNMPVDRAKDTILELVDAGLLEQEINDGSTYYSVTVRGHQYLELYKRMAGLVGIPIPEPIVGM